MSIPAAVFKAECLKLMDADRCALERGLGRGRSARRRGEAQGTPAPCRLEEMSAFLLDTHVWLWYAEGVTERLRPAGVRNCVALATRDERFFEYAKQGFLRVVSV
jgi:hypothetical protein